MTSFIVNTPSLRLLVDQSYLGITKQPKLEECYLVAVTSVPSKPLAFTVHLESGAVWQRLPIAALWTDSRLYPVVNNVNGLIYETETLQPYSCLEGSINCLVYEHLKHYEVRARIGNVTLLGMYLMTIDVLGDGLASDPVQHKSHNVIVLENGQLAALPNNHLLFIDKYFTVNSKIEYKRSNQTYWAGG